MTAICSGKGKKIMMVGAKRMYLRSALTAQVAVTSSFSIAAALASVVVILAAMMAMVDSFFSPGCVSTAVLRSEVYAGWRWKG